MSSESLAVAIVVAVLIAACGVSPVAQAAVPRFCRVSGAVAALNARRNDGRKGGQNRQAGVILLVSNVARSPGEAIYARPANFSKRPAGYGAEFRIERRVAGGWMPDPASPHGPWPARRGRLNAGDAGRCYRFDIPSEETAGLYRFSTRLYVRLDKPPVFRAVRFRIQ